MINCAFLPVFYEYHQSRKGGLALPDYENYAHVESIWMSFYALGRMEVYQFIYGECRSSIHFEEWLIRLKGEDAIRQSAIAFDQWTRKENTIEMLTDPAYPILSDTEMEDWRENGYIKVSNLVDGHLCDAVAQLICGRLGVDLSDRSTWYNSHPDWHGLMLQIYQDDGINAIKTLPAIRQLFTQLYATSDIISNTEKVSFNPPETVSWKFAHNRLHWDIDLADPDLYYIQGLIYLNDVPEDRGPLTVVPGFHRQFDSWIKTYPDFHQAHQVMQDTFPGTPLPGKKGDIILWQQTLPHAASANRSDLPRFVQYISFSKL